MTRARLALPLSLIALLASVAASGCVRVGPRSRRPPCKRGSCTLHHRARWRIVHTKHERNTEHAFVADKTHFERLGVVDRHDQRDETLHGEIDVINAIAGRVQYGGKHEFDVLASGWKSTSIGGRQRFEQAMDGGARWVGFIGTLLALR